jgi:hypothetical protein
MTKSISNTLQRWKIIADRIKELASESQNKIGPALTLSDSVDFDTFEVRRGTLQATAEKVKAEVIPLHEALVKAVYQIRRELAHANVKFGVADLLCEQEMLKVLGADEAEVINEATPALQPDEFLEIGRKRAAQPQANNAPDVLGRVRGVPRPRVTLLTPGELAEKVAKREALRLKMQAVSDRLSDANANRISIEIDPRVAAAIGL